MTRRAGFGASLLTVMVTVALVVPVGAVAAAPATPEVDAVDGRLLVTWRASATPTERQQVRERHGLTTEQVVAGLDLEAVAVPVGTDAQTLDRVAAEPAVAVAERDHLLRQAAPNDPGWNDLWGLHNVGQLGGPGDVDIDAPEAWRHTTGSRSVVVAVIDTGVDVGHPDLADNIWTNPGEIPGNGIDDDGNGYVDDVHGWDFLHDDATVYDGPEEDFHGTHVAGTIAAVGDNGIGVVGVAPNVQIMPLKFLGSGDESGSTLDAVRAIQYAAAHGARVINASWGGSEGGETLRAALDRASDLVFVAAVGNEGLDLDVTPRYPAEWARDRYGMGHVLSVTSLTPAAEMPSHANYGAQSVDVAAPGVEIVSTAPGRRYAYNSGTSMAAPHAAGAAALAASLRPALSGAAIVDAIHDGVVEVGALGDVTTTGGLLNAARTLDRLAADTPTTSGSASGELAAGEMLTTDTSGTGATPEVPVQTSLLVPEPGAVEIIARPATTGLGANWAPLGTEVAVAAPTATATTPLELTFRLDGSLDAEEVVVVRDGAPVAECPKRTTATPDPCVSRRTTEGDDTVLQVLAARGGTWQFAHPTVACPAGRVPDRGFTDVGVGVHAAAIDCVAWWEVAKGTTGTTFTPLRDVTRAEMAAFVARTLRRAGVELPAGPDAFGDDDGSLFEADIDALAAAGVVQGIGGGRYGPDRKVSRAEMAAFLVRADTVALGVAPTATGDAFDDDDGTTLEVEINMAHAAGLVQGITADTYRPAASVVRAEMATFLRRLLDRWVAKELVRTPAR